MQQRIVLFVGQVQGVGFRFTAHRVAGKFNVTGYVRNLPDGRVECLIEGEADEIDAYLSAVSDRMSGYIEDRTEQVAPATGAFAGFGVRH